MGNKIDKRGKITIPKSIRDEFGFTSGVSLRIDVYRNCGGPEITLCPEHICSACGKALPDELVERGACLDCTPIPRETIIIY